MSKLAMITGATSGIGKATAEKFASEGWNIIITGRRKERLEEFAAYVRETYPVEVLELVFDIRDNELVKNSLNSLSDNWRAIDVLVNNAGLAVGLNPIQEGVVDDWERMIDTNVKGLLYVSRVVLPWMVARAKGHVINIGSVAGKEVYPNGNVYCASKFAVDALTKGMRLDLVQHGIRVSQVAPGAANTEFSVVRFKGDQERADNVYNGFEPLSGSDVSDVIWYIASLPPHMNINDLVLMPAAQASATVLHKK
jgi:NADP-dependent 3-hydroxy acid dehydrogenase YdfG